MLLALLFWRMTGFLISKFLLRGCALPELRRVAIETHTEERAYAARLTHRLLIIIEIATVAPPILSKSFLNLSRYGCFTASPARTASKNSQLIRRLPDDIIVIPEMVR
jgi:hypothetical protein